MFDHPDWNKKEDSKLAIGQKVLARWSANGFVHQGSGKIVVINKRSVTVHLLETVGTQGEYRIGSKICVPRYADNMRWSSNHCVRFVNKEGYRHKDCL